MRKTMTYLTRKRILLENLFSGKRKENSMKNITENTIGVFVGRFQTPDLHDGHSGLLMNVIGHKNAIVFIGVHPIPCTKSNPLDFATRKQMLEQYFSAIDCNSNILILPLHDHPSDIAWSKNLDGIVEGLYPGKKVTLYDGRIGFSKRYHGKHIPEIIGEVPNVSATELRNNVSIPQSGINSNYLDPYETFRSGVIYGVNQAYHKVSAAVDIACYRGKGEDIEILLGVKAHTPNVYRFPGGIVDIDDESWEQAACRELYEETDIDTDVENLYYICSRHVNDWRTTPDNAYKTTFFAIEWKEREPHPKDDLVEVTWIKLVDVLENRVMVSTEHLKLVDDLVKHFINNGRYLK